MGKLLTVTGVTLASILVVTGCSTSDTNTRSFEQSNTNNQETPILNTPNNNFSEEAVIENTEKTQEEVRELGQEIMPFSLGETQHYFVKTKNGGVQTVIVFDLEKTDEIQKIREHLQEIATQFREGNYTNPEYIHGENMPGLETLQTNPGKITITYNENPAGGYITYESSDPEIIQAVHGWFDAQVHDHGNDASSSVDDFTQHGDFGHNMSEEMMKLHHGE